MIGTTSAIILGTLALGGTAAAITTMNKSASKSYQSEADAAASAAKQAAAEQNAADAAQEESNSNARRALLAESTSGFGPNKNLARSFLTSL